MRPAQRAEHRGWLMLGAVEVVVTAVGVGLQDTAKATAPSPKCCGLVVKAGIVDLTRDDRAMIYGAMLWIADKLKREGGEHARDTWKKLGKMAFEMERPAGAHTTEK
ncbi:conjugal transfer protein TraD [Sulfitobacter sp. 1A12779]|uniref:conjugal transfer protein TraD n=1 Tax=Sulfitobacter sp. 1A12779 TaxID=3368599 RepID=UPI003744B59D